MRILFLTPQWPYPPHKGTTLRNYNVIKCLAARHTIDVLSLIPAPDSLAATTPVHNLCRRCAGIPAPLRRMAQRALDTLFSPWPDLALRGWSREFAATLAQWLAATPYDIVQIEGLEMARYLLEHAITASVFDAHNCEYVLQQRTFETDRRQPARGPGAAYSWIQWKKLRRFEAQVCQSARRVVAVSEADAAALDRLGGGPIAVIPNGIDLSAAAGAPAPPDPATLNLVFTGTMDYRPNVDAVVWFAEQVLPRILAQEPAAHFYIVGQRPHQRLQPLRRQPAITLTGAVKDIQPYLQQAAIYVVPLRIGGGTRFKILEAAAAQRAIVSTPVGCEGFPVQDGRELVLADTPESFAAAVVALWRDPARRRQLGAQAYQFAQAFDWQRIAPRFEAVYASLIEESVRGHHGAQERVKQSGV